MPVIRWFVLAVALALSATPGVASGAAAVSPRHPAYATPPNIILITLDTTRADRMGFLGSKRGLTPNLDELARQSSIFTRAYSQAPFTPTSHATIFTGTYPQFHQILQWGTTLSSDIPFLPAILKTRGYSTAAFVGSVAMDPSWGVPGFQRGFDKYDADFHGGEPGEDRYTTLQRRGNEVVAHALAWLSSQSSKHPKGPFFIWIHLYDAHDPYDPPEPYKTKYSSALYDGGIAYEDAVVGKFFRQLKTRGLYDGALVAVTADHGESLGAHGEETHELFLYDETIRVPLLIKPPHAAAGSKRIENPVELVDMAPTILDQIGVTIPPEMQGQSLLGLMKNKSATQAVQNPAPPVWHDRPAYSQSVYPHSFGWGDLQSLRAEKYLYIQAPRRELYDIAADPLAEHNLAQSSSAIADTLAAQLQALRTQTTTSKQAPKAATDLATREKLGALGYMAGTETGKNSSADGNADSKAPDPKDKVEIANMLHRAEQLQQSAHPDESIALLQQIIAQNPTPALYVELGTWLIRQRDFKKAVPVLHKALELDPDSTGARFLLGKSLLALQDYAGAITELEKMVAKVPNAIDAHSYLELAYAQTKRYPEAIRECKIVLGFDPEDGGSYLIMGQSLARMGDPQAGVAALKKAISLQPGMPVAHIWLAEVYDQLGQKKEAEAERVEAKRLQTAPQE